MISRQMELSIENQPGFRRASRSQSRASRARWWFEQMREVVSEARDWPPVSPPRHAPRPVEDETSPGPASS